MTARPRSGFSRCSVIALIARAVCFFLLCAGRFHGAASFPVSLGPPFLRAGDRHFQKQRQERSQVSFSPDDVHVNPCPTVGVIVRGAVSFQIESEEQQTLHAGDAFFEPANRHVMRFDDNGASPAVFAAFYLMSHEGQERLKSSPVNRRF